MISIASAISAMPSTMPARRPYLSPITPSTTPPTGRMKKPTPNTAVVASSALICVAGSFGSTGKNTVLMIGVM